MTVDRRAFIGGTAAAVGGAAALTMGAAQIGRAHV